MITTLAVTVACLLAVTGVLCEQVRYTPERQYAEATEAYSRHEALTAAEGRAPMPFCAWWARWERLAARLGDYTS